MNPINTLNHQKEYLNSIRKNIDLLIYQLVNDKKYKFKLLSEKLEILNPLAIMDKGYSINKINDEIITDITKVKKGDILTTTLKNGNIISEVIEVNENGK